MMGSYINDKSVKCNDETKMKMPELFYSQCKIYV